jgi:LDH2 family malate/lactate/ureidoglycolate dehydrogenase
MENTISITAGELRNFYTAVFAKLDFDAARRRTLSEIILASSDYQAASVLFDRVTSGLIDPKALPVHGGKKRRSEMIDGAHTEPHLTCLLAMERACENAASEGVGLVLVRGLLPVRRLRLYEKVAAAHGLAAVVREAVYEDMADAKITHSFLAVDPGHFGDREDLSPLLIEFVKKTCDIAIPAPYGTDPSFENEGTARTYTGNITAAYKNRDLIEVPSSVADDWNEIAAALEIRSPLIR